MSDPLDRELIESPPWQPGTRLMAGVLIIVLLVFLLYLLRSLIVTVLLAFIVAYILYPLAAWFTHRTRIPRGLSAFIILLVFLLILLGMTTWLGFAFSDRVVSLAGYLSDIAKQLPGMIEQLPDLRFGIGSFMVDLSQSNLTALLSDIVGSLSPLLAEAGSVIRSIALAAASTVSTSALILVISYYLIADFDKLSPALIRLAPPAYREDMRCLLGEADRIWRAFFRGQLVLGVVIGVSVAILMIAAGLDFPLVMGVIAGILELVPMVGPFVSAVIAAVLALFQPTNIWGLTPLAFSIVIIAIFIVIQQIENTVLVPRVIGENLNLPPLLVFLAILAGGIIGGLVGVLLAAPILATSRLFLGYIYYKVVDLEERPGPVLEPRLPSRRLARFRQRLVAWWQQRRTPKRTEESDT
ncbi:MAG: AI-2E family transporter [Anaerolineales bacterium]|nr:MAG: AI-2E family transporter [Anaerolineales bacterium]